ncbi:toll/interleukin-1 receptor domain-containing protein [Thauera sp. 63]|uniref:toll/interleukin-1 receptor domain-containing protein n=1 Tax=Thauera sp. 63 TaxID=497321 RepID=UPI0002CDDBE3|nr:toll/interleukin-1 receptor domain-containing protein [Thauera sp. 63]ENO75081.1 PASTA-related domain-containing protein [Thauera sp. 63]
MPAYPHILVVGTTFTVPLPWYRPFRRLADMVGRELARSGFGLLTGNTPGVDKVAARAFWAECLRRGLAPEAGYQQLWLPHFQRGYFLPGEGFAAPVECTVRLSDYDEWIEQAIGRAGAAVMIGGRSGSLAIARRFIDAGKPVLPIPFAGGESREVFHEILRTWGEAPVPGLRQTQFLSLAVPWINSTGPLARLLLGTLAAQADIFISYRRADTGMAAGRLRDDLIEHFGARRVFMDLHGIDPSADWRETIGAAIAACKVGVVLIGHGFMAGDAQGRPRLWDEGDVLRFELASLLAGQKRILPLLVDDAPLPAEDALPEALRPLLRYQTPRIDNANWQAVSAAVVRAIEAVLSPSVG